VQRRMPSAKSIARYKDEGSHGVELDLDEVTKLGRRVIRADVIDEDMETGLVRHDHEQLAGVLLRWYARVREDAKAELR
jgi:hypothetical protein